MPEPSATDPIFTPSPPASRPLVAVPDYSAPVPNPADPIPNRSAPVPNGSEPLPNGSASVPNGAVAVPNAAPLRSDLFGTARAVPNEPPEVFRTAPVCTAADGDHTITVREAARLFEEAGVPRTERALTKWCNRNARGLTRLVCCYHEPERKYYLTPASIERVIAEERQRQHADAQGLLSDAAEALAEQLRADAVPNGEPPRSEPVPNRSEPNSTRSEPVPNRSEPNPARSAAFRTVPNTGGPRSEPVRNHSEPQAEPFRARPVDDLDPDAAQERQRLKELQMENYELKVQLEGQKYLIRKFDELVEGERARHAQEKLALVDRLTDARHQIGALEQQLLTLAAPKTPARDAELDSSREPVYRAPDSDRPRFHPDPD